MVLVIPVVGGGIIVSPITYTERRCKVKVRGIEIMRAVQSGFHKFRVHSPWEKSEEPSWREVWLEDPDFVVIEFKNKEALMLASLFFNPEVIGWFNIGLATAEPTIRQQWVQVIRKFGAVDGLEPIS